jgi:hypothetical protein
MASPAVTDPPGEFIYNLMGSVGFSASRKRSWAVRSVDGMSDTFHQQLSEEENIQVLGRLLVPEVI